MDLQEYSNLVLNVRKTRALVSQLGLFKVRKGSGVTAQMVSRLAANGAIQVTNMDDIQQMPMQDASPSSYKDEEVIQSWSAKVTSTYESATGESLPASTPATNAVLQSRTAQSQFELIREGIGLFISRWLKRQALPIMMKNVKRDDIVRLTGETDELKEYDERVVSEIIWNELQNVKNRGGFVDPAAVQRERERLISQMSMSGKDRFVKVAQKIDWTEFDVQVYVTNEEVDKAVLAKNLIDTLGIVASKPDLNIDSSAIVRQIFDVMGLDTNQLKTNSTMIPPDLMAAMGGPPGSSAPGAGSFSGAPATAQSQVTAAVT